MPGRWIVGRGRPNAMLVVELAVLLVNENFVRGVDTPKIFFCLLLQ